jgi:hypothetical protein
MKNEIGRPEPSETSITWRGGSPRALSLLSAHEIEGELLSSAPP